MRNPWGAFEWSGDWCDDSPKWDQNPKVKKACKASGKKEDDGLFWMEWADFQKHFQNIDVCHRSRGIADVRLDINEDAGCIGPVKGCIGGCAEFYCCCKGVGRLCCPTDHKVAGPPKSKEEDAKPTSQP